MHPVNRTAKGSPRAERTEWSHNLHVSPATIHHTEAVFSIVREIYGREHDDPMNDLDVNMAIWSLFLNTTLRAAVHLGQDHDANSFYVKNNFWNSVGLFFHETGKLISEQKDITCVSTKDIQDATWMSTSLLCEKIYRITSAKVDVFSDSVLCVVKMGNDPIATWKCKIKLYSENIHFKDMNRIAGTPTEFEWINIPRNQDVGPPQEDSKSNERLTM